MYQLSLAWTAEFARKEKPSFPRSPRSRARSAETHLPFKPTAAQKVLAESLRIGEARPMKSPAAG